MTLAQWNSFCEFKNEFKAMCKKWSRFSDELIPLQKAAAKSDTPDYPIENPIVYNTALDEITMQSEIKLIVIGDNPGKDEQLNKNQKYLVGQAGKIGEGFFKKNPELNIDFRKDVIILNKTPVHSAKTTHLKSIEKNGSAQIKNLLLETQNWMAKKTAALHLALIEGASKNSFIPELWLVGYSELKPKKIFTEYKNTLQAEYKNAGAQWEKVFVFQHFSMNRFSIDLKEFSEAAVSESENNSLKTLKEKISALGKKHKEEIISISV